MTDHMRAPAKPPADASDDRKTITVPPGYEDVRDAEGRATGEVRKIPTDAQSVGMREALRPFAEISLWRDMYPDAKEDFLTARQLQGYIKVEDVRRARAAFASQPSPAATVETDIDALTGTADDQGMFASHEGSSAGKESEPPEGQLAGRDCPGVLESDPALFNILNNALGTMHYHRLMSALNWNGYVITREPQSSGVWQLIETAPSVEWGKSVDALVYSPQIGIKSAAIGSNNGYIFASVSSYNGNAVESWGVTHWMPLPTPPFSRPHGECGTPFLGAISADTEKCRSAENLPQEVMDWKAEALRRFGPIPPGEGENSRLIAGYHYAFVEGAKLALSVGRHAKS